jgi:raffinose/stachyose/melibiose transport system permease protein
MRHNNRPAQLLTYLAALAVMACFVVPMALVALNSLKSATEAVRFDFTLPAEWMWSNYTTVLSDPAVTQGFLNSIIISSAVTTATILVCSLASYVIARRFDRFSARAYSYLLIGLIAPFAFLPAIRVLQLTGLYNTHVGLILVDVATQIPFITLIQVGFVRQIPRELDESAVIDGAGPLTVFFRIILPLMRPVTTTSVVLVFTFAWNEFQNVLFLTSGSKVWTLPMTVYNYQGLHTHNYALVCANLVITLIPAFIVYLIAQKHILSGVTAGAVKG